MDEELKQELIAALKGIQSGSIDAWSHLAAEQFNYGVLIILYSVILSIMSALCLKLSSYFNKKVLQAPNYSQKERWASFVVVSIIAAITFLIMSLVKLNSGIEYVARPSITLIQGIK